MLRPLLQTAETERLAVLHLDGQGGLIGVDCHDGASTEVMLPVREIIAQALRRDARAMVLAHNHPSGRLEPSAGDIEAIGRLATVCAAIGIDIADHLIFAGGECVSLRALGLI